MRNFKRSPTTGQFVRQHYQWALDNFDDGYIDNHGRFRGYSPTHPRADSMGYVMRAVIAYEAYHDVSVKKGYDIHHVDNNRLNDSRANLTVMTHAEHTRLTVAETRPGKQIACQCRNCGTMFILPQWRLKESGRGSYCSQACYKAAPKSEESKQRRSASMKLAYAQGRH